MEIENQKTKIIHLSDFIPLFKRIKVAIEEYNLIIIYGEEGTGKTMFVKDCLVNFKNKIIKNVDSSTEKSTILNYFKTIDFIHKYKIMVYDDSSIRKDILTSIAELLESKNITNKFIVIVNKLRYKPKEYQIFETRYPTKEEIYRFVLTSEYNRVREDPPKEPIDDQLKKILINLNPANMRRIEMSIEDGYFSGEIPEKEVFDITKNNFLLSFSIAENINRLTMFTNLVDADKLKYVNKHFYFDYVKLHYAKIDKMRLRYPKKLIELSKHKKEKELNNELDELELNENESSEAE